MQTDVHLAGGSKGEITEKEDAEVVRDMDLRPCVCQGYGVCRPGCDEALPVESND